MTKGKVGAQGLTPLFAAVDNNAKINEIKKLINKEIINIQDPDTGVTVLHNAVMKKDPILVKLLIDNGADLNIADKSKLTPLELALEFNISSINNIIIDKYVTKESGENTLHAALRLDNKYKYKLIENLIKDHPEYLTQPNKEGKVPLEIILKSNNIELKKTIINNINADDMRASPEESILLLKMALENNDIEFVKLLKEKIPEIISYAIEQKVDIKTINLLLENATEDNLHVLNTKGKSPLSLAIDSDDPEIVESFIKSPNINFTRTNAYLINDVKIQVNPLEYAMFTSKFNSFHRFLTHISPEKESIPNKELNPEEIAKIKKITEILDPVFIAALYNENFIYVESILPITNFQPTMNVENWEAMIELVSKEGSVENRTQLISKIQNIDNSENKSKLLNALFDKLIIKKDLVNIKLLIENKDVASNKNNIQTYLTSLLQTDDLESTKKRTEIIEYLIDKTSVEILNQVEVKGQPISFLTSHIDQLIKKNIDLNIRNKAGETVLHGLATHGKNELLNKLINAGARIDIKDEIGDYPIHSAFKAGQVETCKILNDSDSKLQDINGNTALHLSIMEGKTDLSEMLVKSSEDLTIKNKDGNTPLHLILEKIQSNQELKNQSDPTQKALFDLAKAIIKKSPESAKIVNNNVDNPLHILAKQKILEGNNFFSEVTNEDERSLNNAQELMANDRKIIAKALIDAGADYNAKNKYDKRPIDLAIENRLSPIVEVIKKEDSLWNRLKRWCKEKFSFPERKNKIEETIIEKPSVTPEDKSQLRRTKSEPDLTKLANKEESINLSKSSDGIPNRRSTDSKPITPELVNQAVKLGKPVHNPDLQNFAQTSSQITKSQGAEKV